MNPTSTHFVRRLRERDSEAWFELWENFGPILRAQLQRWGAGRIGWETAQDLSQETLTALASAIDRHDPSKGARFSTWLFSIARYTLGDEIDRRMAQKRGEGSKPVALDAAADTADGGLSPDGAYEEQIFDAKIQAALRAVERQAGLADFEVFRQRVLEGRSGSEVAEDLGLSVSAVSRCLTKVREQLWIHLGSVFSRYSFTPEEDHELERNGLTWNPNKELNPTFDQALADIYARLTHRQDPSPIP
ncbi:MAG: sigma-70 family RNA polymerase sigma factor [Planctomycetes bacterium]|nr:sigma-70 family RNA polymerase sigma factor [Planctomycetota bacterium]MCB9910154.1 sigma-70 family RNA polymerase sigma factor [Planctomycetota bacterium]